MDVGIIIAIVVIVVLVIAIVAFLVPRMRQQRERRELERRREHVVDHHRGEAHERERRAEHAEMHAKQAELHAQKERAEAEMHETRARMHEEGHADEELRSGAALPNERTDDRQDLDRDGMPDRAEGDRRETFADRPAPGRDDEAARQEEIEREQRERR